MLFNVCNGTPNQQWVKLLRIYFFTYEEWRLVSTDIGLAAHDVMLTS